MQMDVVGVLTFLVGFYVLMAGPTAGFTALVLSTTLGAAAALKLPALGGASIMPAHVLLGFFLITICRDRDLRSTALAATAPGRSGFWLLCFVAFGVLSAYFLPRIFYNATTVYSAARAPTHPVVLVLPLGPSAANVTQSVYLIADLLGFAAIAAYASRVDAALVARVLLITAAVSLGFVILDLVTSAAGASALMDVIRNANYRMLNEGEIKGFKRIVGSYTETSGYSYVALGYLGFCLSLWLDGVWPRITLALAALVGLTLVLSTSSTAYVSLAVFGVVLFVASARRVGSGRATPQQVGLVVGGPPVALVLLLTLALIPSVWSALSDLFGTTVFNKLNSASGVERSAWNHGAWKVFVDTFGFGGGVGSVRASSLFMAALGSVGVFGTTLLVGFLWSIVRKRSVEGRSDAAILSRAGAWGVVPMIAAAAVSTGNTDLSLPFFILAGTACSLGLRRAAPRPFAPEATSAIGPWPRRHPSEHQESPA